MRQVSMVKVDADPVKAVVVETVAEPVCPKAGVVVAVGARPINPADVLLLTGRHVFTPSLPAPVGIEGSGVVIEAGADSHLRVGQHVVIPFGGTWRERMALDDDNVFVIPDHVDLEQAAMLAVNPFTALDLLQGVPAGATIALNAAASSVGRLVLTLCRKLRINAIAVVRNERSAAQCLEGGALAVVIDGEDLGKRIRDVAPSAVVRGLDAVAGDASARMFGAVSDGGTLIVYGLLSDDVVRLPAAALVFHGVTVQGYTRLRSLRAMTRTRRDEIVAELVTMLDAGSIVSPVEARYPLQDVAVALAHQQRSDRSGKILLV